MAWNTCVKSFQNWDIYYLNEYAYSFMLHGDGEPLLIYYEDKTSRFCYVVMKRDISNFEKFKGYLSPNAWYDLETPYGYGGPLSDTSISDASQKQFETELYQYCHDNHIVSQFVRFHPLLLNHQLLSHVIETRYLRDTIYMDTTTPDLILNNMDSKNRNMVRKAKKNNVTIIKKDITEFQDFIPMYDETMKKNHADEYYTFPITYFNSLKQLKNNACIFYALYENKPISGSIMFFNEKYMHYHLSGSHNEYRKYSPGNLLLYEAACWASKKGIKKFHLGGGMLPDDTLFGFKKQFNKNGRSPFVVGRTIFDKKTYHELVMLRKKLDSDFDENNDFMIQYRK